MSTSSLSPADGDLSPAVFVRVAPPRHGACAFVIRNRTDNSSSAAVVSLKSTGTSTSVRKQKHKRDARQQQPQSFSCHQAFGPDHDNSFVYFHALKHRLESAVVAAAAAATTTSSGSDSSAAHQHVVLVIAGHCSSGRGFTVIGEQSQPGLLILAASALLNLIPLSKNSSSSSSSSLFHAGMFITDSNGRVPSALISSGYNMHTSHVTRHTSQSPAPIAAAAISDLQSFASFFSNAEHLRASEVLPLNHNRKTFSFPSFQSQPITPFISLIIFATLGRRQSLRRRKAQGISRRLLRDVGRRLE
jgi:hypothetical protein